MKQLLQKTTPENIKCICLTLKLAGYDLEKDCPKELKDILLLLKNVNRLDFSTSRILESVLKLQENRWGRINDSNDYQTNPTVIRNSDEPVFYGPDGKILTEEENSFLASITDNNDEIDSDLEFNPEMDAETESAYKDFLKTSFKN